MGASGQATLDFGAFPGASDTSLVITGQLGIVAGSLVEAWIFPAQTADHSPDEHILETFKVFAGNIIAGTGFTIYGVNTSQLNESLDFPGIAGFGVAANAIYGSPAASVGGTGTRIYGVWNIGWVWC